MRICILGNSHLASLKQGWDQMQPVQGVSVQFFGSRQRGLQALDRVGTELRPRHAALARDLTFTSGGLDRIDLQNHDVFLLYGLMLALPGLQQGWSTAVKRQACKDTLGRSLAAELLQKIRAASDRPIYLGHNPRPARRGQQALPAGSLDYPQVFEHMRREVHALGATLLPQPEQTLEDNRWFTRSSYSTGSVRLDVGDRISAEQHPESDLEHMNADFGRRYLTQFLSGLRPPGQG